MTKTISDLSLDLLGEILSRTPLTSLSAVRSTCKTWNALSKVQIFGKRAEARKKQQFLEFMTTKSKLFSLNFDLRNDEEDSINPSVKQISILGDQEIEIITVFHCEGLFLCLTKEDNTRLVIWNPYLGQTKWIQPRTEFCRSDRFALGYNNNKQNHKILRVFDESGYKKGCRKKCIEVYDLAYDSWRVLDVPPNSYLNYQTCVSLKGNSYFFGQKGTKTGLVVTDTKEFLVCFDFRTERFGPPLSLPFSPPSDISQYVAKFWVRDEKLSVLYNHYNTYQTIEIWITNKIEPDSVSWSKFLRVDMSLVNGLPDDFLIFFIPRNFFIDEEKKVAVIFAMDGYEPTKIAAYIVGENGYFQYVKCEPGNLVCSSYVPSLVQL